MTWTSRLGDRRMATFATRSEQRRYERRGFCTYPRCDCAKNGRKPKLRACPNYVRMTKR